MRIGRGLSLALPLLAGAALASTAVAAVNPVDAVNHQIERGRDREALQALKPMMQTRPGSSTLLMLRGRAQLALGQVSAAVESFRAAVAADPHGGEAYFWLGQSLARRIPQVDMLAKPALARELRSAYQKAVELSPQRIEAHEALLDFYLQAPGFFGGSMVKARRQAALIAHLNAARGARAEALIAGARGDNAAATHDYVRAIALAPDDAGLRVDLGDLYRKTGHPQQACTMYRQALRLDPERTEAVIGLSRSAPETGDRAEMQAALTALDHLIAAAPENLRDSLKTLEKRRARLRKQIHG